MPQDRSENRDNERPEFDLFEKTHHTGEISSKPYEATSGFSLGELIGGSYKVLAFIGEGGMGLVYKVEHIVMNKILALKVLKTEHLSENVWKRFRLEGQAISRLEHANIIKIFDMNQTPDGRPFYTMELLTGVSLADYLQEHNHLELKMALPIFRQVCSALAYAHERGIIHRDIKPGNIMLLEEPNSSAGFRAKIVDFGIVKLVDERSHLAQGLTMQGEVFGSPLYMSPEQCAGSKLDGRADMYSVGVSLFQALTGKPPLVGRTAAETTIMHHTTEPPTLAEVGGIDYPPALEEIVAKMLAKDPEDRFSSLSEVANHLLFVERQPHQPLPLTLPSRPSTDSQPLFDTDRITRQHFESEVPTTSSTSNKNSQVLLAVAACFSVVALLAISFLGLRLWTTSPKQRPVITTASYSKHEDGLEVSKKDQKRELEALEPTASSESDDIIAKFVRNRKEPYFKPGKNGRMYFTFPGELSIGVVETIGKHRMEPNQAQGQFDLPPWRELCFTTNTISIDHPELLQFFPANSLDALKFGDEKKLVAPLAVYLRRQQNIRALVMSAVNINEADLKTICTLKKLTTLGIGCNYLSDKTIIDSKILDKLEFAGLVGAKDCTAILKRLARNKNLRDLNLANCDLKKCDFAILATMSQLTSLNCDGTRLDDKDLLQLTKLQNLTSLNLIDTAITENSFPTLNKFVHVGSPALPPELATKYYNLR